MFGPQPKVDPAKLVQLIQQQSRVYKLDGRDKLRFIRELPDVEARAMEVEALLAKIGI